MLGARRDQGRLGQHRRRRRHGVDDQRAAPAQQLAHRHPLRQRRDARPHGLRRPDQSLRRQGHGRVRRHGTAPSTASTARRRTPSPPRASAARRPRSASGAFEDEIVPVTVKGRKGDVVVDTDEEPGKIDLAKIPRLRPAFEKDGIAHRRQLLEDQRRRRRPVLMSRRRSGQARAQAAGAHRRPRHAMRRRRSGSPPRRSSAIAQRAGQGRLERGRRRPVRDQRSVRRRRHGADARTWASRTRSSTSTAARSPWAIRSAPAARG